VEADECGGLNELLAAAPQAAPLCGGVGALVSVNDLADRPARGLADAERLSIGKKSVTWFHTPHVPHGWDCGFLYESQTRTLLGGDLSPQWGAEHAPATEVDIVGPSEAFRHAMDYYSPTALAASQLDRLASTEPVLLACMHGSAWRGDGARALRELKGCLTS